MERRAFDAGELCCSRNRTIGRTQDMDKVRTLQLFTGLGDTKGVSRKSDFGPCEMREHQDHVDVRGGSQSPLRRAPKQDNGVKV